MVSYLAQLYCVKTKRLNVQVKRNPDRFPKDFMFQLTFEEREVLRSQNATSSWGGRRVPPYIFTEQGVAMLSSVINSRNAIQVNISFIRVFVNMRKWVENYEELINKINSLIANQHQQEEHIEKIYRIIDELIRPRFTERKSIGFKVS